MKKLIIITLAVALMIPAIVYAQSFGEKYDKVVTYFQGETEPTALDAIWDSKVLLKIGMMDDDQDKNAYAEHACDIINKEGLPSKGIEVRIIDIQKLAFKEEWVVLGKAVCK